jgi:uncharacterized membrane protein
VLNVARDSRDAAMAIRIRGFFALPALAAFCALAAPARADLQICSRMSYVVEAATAIESKGAATTRGWPLPQAGHANFCIGSGSFVMPAIGTCNRAGQQIARFTAVKPTETEKGLTAYLAEDAEYTDERACDAAIQRLLVIAGYDANPIDGIRGAKTDAALLQFITDNKLENTAAGRSDFFDVLMAAAQKPASAGFSWCNETKNTVMAALGVEDNGAVVTRGWYRVAPDKCLRPDLGGRPQRLYSLGEAVGPDGTGAEAGRGPGRAGVVLGWRHHPLHAQQQVRIVRPQGLHRQRPDRHRLCHRGTGFATVELTGSTGVTVQFK